MELSLVRVQGLEPVGATQRDSVGAGGHSVERGIGLKIEGEHLKAEVEIAAAVGADQVAAGDGFADLGENGFGKSFTSNNFNLSAYEFTV